MSLILGMDAWVFTAWIGTILAAILCILYGIYCQFIKKSDEKKHGVLPEKGPEKQKEE